MSLRIRCLWGIRNALFFVAKDSSAENEEGRKKVLGVAMWMLPKPACQKETWDEWAQSWFLSAKQLGMNLWWGRGGLNVKVRMMGRTSQEKLAEYHFWLVAILYLEAQSTSTAIPTMDRP